MATQGSIDFQIPDPSTGNIYKTINSGTTDTHTLDGVRRVITVVVNAGSIRFSYSDTNESVEGGKATFEDGNSYSYSFGQRKSGRPNVPDTVEIEGLEDGSEYKLLVEFVERDTDRGGLR